MSETDRTPIGNQDWYEIRLQGRLDPRWTACFDGLGLSGGVDGTTVLSGPVADQAALHGHLQRLRDIGLPLVSLTRMPPVPRTPDQGELT